MSGHPTLPKPTWVPLDMRCGACQYEWEDWQPCNCAPEVWIAALKALFCPKCGAERKLMIRTGSKGSEDGWQRR